MEKAMIVAKNLYHFVLGSQIRLSSGSGYKEFDTIEDYIY